MGYDRKTFFDSIRSNLPANRSLSQTQVDGFNILLDEAEKRNLDTDWVAYILATVWWETDYTMQPIKEGGGDAYLRSKKYFPYYGRGYVQLTWSYNYKIMGNWIGVDLVNNPDLALKPDIATKVLFEGMIRGMFTAKKLSDYIAPDSIKDSDEKDYQEFLRARAIVNGTDKAAEIAKYAIAIDHALTAAQTVIVTPPVPAPVPAPVTPSPTPAPAPAPVPVVVGPPPTPPVIDISGPKLWTIIGTGTTAIIGMLNSFNPIIQGIIVVAVIGGLAFLAYEAIHSKNQRIGSLF